MADHAATAARSDDQSGPGKSKTRLRCDDDNDENPSKPIIHLTEIGSENSKIAVAGGDLHLEGNIVADGVIQRIDIEIHKKSANRLNFTKRSLFSYNL